MYCSVGVLEYVSVSPFENNFERVLEFFELCCKWTSSKVAFKDFKAFYGSIHVLCYCTYIFSLFVFALAWDYFALNQTAQMASRTPTTSKIEFFVIVTNDFQPLIAATKSSILDLAVVLNPSFITGSHFVELGLINLNPLFSLFSN